MKVNAMVKKGDFVKIHYTGKLADGVVFDTTRKDVADKEGLADTRSKFEPVTICVGEGMLIRGLDSALEGKEGSFSATIQPEEAFGKKNPKLLRVVPTPQLNKQGIRPQAGMRLNVDGNYGVVLRTGGGRTVVDFNHPLASQEVTYDVEIVEKVTDAKEQIRSIFEGASLPLIDVSVEKDAATIKLPQLFPQPILDRLQERITQLTKVKTVSFEQGTKK